MKKDDEYKLDQLDRAALWLEPVMIHMLKMLATWLILLVAEWLFVKPFGSNECLITVWITFALWVRFGKPSKE